jgi:hypothetical protein
MEIQKSVTYFVENTENSKEFCMSKNVIFCQVCLKYTELISELQVLYSYVYTYDS